MNGKIQKRGRKIFKKFSRFGQKVGEDSIEHIQENVINRIDHIKNIRLLILEWSLLVLAIIFLGLTQAFWYVESYAVTTYVRGGTYTEATLGEVNNLNPLFASTNSERVLSRLLFATLTAPDYTGHTSTTLLKSIKPDATGKVWTVSLKPNLKWSDGEPITAEDIVYTVETIQSQNINTIYSTNLAGVKVTTAKTETEERVLFTLPAAYNNFPSALNFPLLPEHVLKDVAPENLLENQFSWNPVTSGAFKYNATQNVGNRGETIVYLNANKNYYKGAPTLDSFVVHAYPDQSQIIDALNAGSVTATAELSADQVSDLNNPNIISRNAAISSGVYAFFNTTSENLSNKKMRQALRQGIDVDKLISDTLDSESRLDYPVLESQLSQELPALPEHNEKDAKDLIAELKKGTILNIATVNYGHLPAIAEALSEQLGELGVEAVVTSYEPDQDFLVNIIRPRMYDILVYEIELGVDSDLFAYYHSSQATENGINLSNYANSYSDDLLIAMRSTMDQKLRAQKYQTWIKQWINDVPAIGLYQANLVYAMNRSVRAFSEDNILVSPSDRFIDVDRWAVNKVNKNRTP